MVKSKRILKVGGFSQKRETIDTFLFCFSLWSCRFVKKKALTLTYFVVFN